MDWGPISPNYRHGGAIFTEHRRFRHNSPNSPTSGGFMSDLCRFRSFSLILCVFLFLFSTGKRIYKVCWRMLCPFWKMLRLEEEVYLGPWFISVQIFLFYNVFFNFFLFFLPLINTFTKFAEKWIALFEKCCTEKAGNIGGEFDL